MKIIKILLSLSAIFLLSNCAALGTSISKKKLDVQTKTSEAVFLDLTDSKNKTIFIQYGNSTGNQDFDDMGNLIKNNILSKGYKISDPDQARYILQIRALEADKSSPSAAEKALKGGYGSNGMGGAIAGGLAGGALFGGGAGKIGTGILGGLIGAAAEVAANSMVKDVSYSLIVDVMISEQKPNSNSIKHQIRVVSTANKVNLKLEEATPEMKKGVVTAISGIFQ